MPTDLTGTPTSLGIGTFNVDADAPSGLGFNAAMAQIDALIAARVAAPSGIASGEVPVWNGSTWVRSSAAKIGVSSLPLTRGTQTATFSASSTSGIVTVTHGLGATPIAVVCQATDGTANAIVEVVNGSVNGTTFQAYLRDIAGSSRTGSQTFYWLAVA